ncbi:MAG: hypothetical protein SPC26_05430 [Lactobacillus amylovorus]|nr:hypothetical protein [Lactobacillus amylovorus]
MNRLIGNNYISVEGKDNALKIAATLLEQDYQVFIQLDDSDIYIVAYTSNDTRYGGDEFAKLNDDEQELVQDYRADKEDKAAIARVKGLLNCGRITKNELINDDDDNVDSNE